MLMPGNILLDVHPKIYPHHLPNSLKEFKSIEDIKIDQLFKIEVGPGPESIAIYNGKLVTGSLNGSIYLIQNDNTTKLLTKIIHAETEENNNKKSGILGLQFNSKGVLFVVKPYYGVYKVENIFTESPKVSLVFDIDQTASLGIPSKFLDDVAIEEKPNGDNILYITDVSTKFNFEEAIMIYLSSDTGRILRFDINNNKLDVLIDNLLFPNGIEITFDKSALLFSEFGARSVWKYSLKGEDKGKFQRIMTNLPAEVDNIRASVTGQTYWLAMLKPRSILRPLETDYYMKKPLLRKLILRTSHLIGMFLDYTTRIIPNEYLTQLANDFKMVKGIHIFSESLEDGGMMLEIDHHGNILNSIYSHTQDLGFISEVREIQSSNPRQRILYLGSFQYPYVRKLIISG